MMDSPHHYEQDGEYKPLIPAISYSRPGYNNIEEEDVELTGCGATAACDPHRALHRYLILVMICLLSFGSYFCFDNPGALQQQIEVDMSVTAQQYMGLYAWYSWPNVFLCFFGGFLIDKVFGIRFGTIVFSTFVTIGQVIFAMGAYFNSIYLMYAGRFVFGIGGESLAVAQSTYSVSWFKHKEVNMVFGLQLSFSRAGSVFNMNTMAQLYSQIDESVGHKKLAYTLLMGAVLCVFSLIIGLILALFDKRAARILNRNKGESGEKVSLTDVKDFPVPLWLIFVICVTYYSAVFPFVSLGLVFFEMKFGASPSEAALMNSIVFLMSMGVSPFMGIVVDKTGRNLFWLMLAIVCTIAAHILLAFTFITPWLAMVLVGIGYSLCACALWPLVSFVVPNHQLGTAYGFMQAIQNLGLALVAMLAGLIVDDFGYLKLEMFFLSTLSLALIMSVILYLYDAATYGNLNSSQSERAAEMKRKERELLKTTDLTSSIVSTVDNSLTARSAFQLRNRYLARIGHKLPPHYDVHSETLSRFSILM